MPEGPELAHSRDQIRELCLGLKVSSITSVGGRYGGGKFPNEERLTCLLSSKDYSLTAVDTHGKFMWWTLFDGHDDVYLHISYGMSGGWHTYATKHTAVEVTFKDGSELFFNDQRHFGTVKFVSEQKEHSSKMSVLGPCILSDPISTVTFRDRLHRFKDEQIGAVLLKQTVVSGVGNYLRAEALHRARINPLMRTRDLDDVSLTCLLSSIYATARESYAAQGASFSTYDHVDGSRGSTQLLFNVYGQKACRECGTKIHKAPSTDGRTCWWCPACQGVYIPT